MSVENISAFACFVKAQFSTKVLSLSHKSPYNLLRFRSIYCLKLIAIMACAVDSLSSSSWLSCVLLSSSSAARDSSIIWWGADKKKWHELYATQTIYDMILIIGLYSTYEHHSKLGSGWFYDRNKRYMKESQSLALFSSSFPFLQCSFIAVWARKPLRYIFIRAIANLYHGFTYLQFMLLYAFGWE